MAVWLGRPTADCCTPVVRRQGKPGRRASIDERAGRREPSSGGDDGRRRQPPDDVLREVRRGRAVQTTLRQNTEAEACPLWNSQPVEVVDERRDVFRAPRQEHNSGGSVEGRHMPS